MTIKVIASGRSRSKSRLRSRGSSNRIPSYITVGEDNKSNKKEDNDDGDAKNLDDFDDIKEESNGKSQEETKVERNDEEDSTMARGGSRSASGRSTPRRSKVRSSSQRNNGQVMAKQPDVLDLLCDWSERMVCSAQQRSTFDDAAVQFMVRPEGRRLVDNSDKDKYHDGDILDYVFEHVESMTCRENYSQHGNRRLIANNKRHSSNSSIGANSAKRGDDDVSASPTCITLPHGKECDISRDNSLVEKDAQGRPANVMMDSKSRSRARRSRSGRPRNGDLLDYVFENVESFVCADNAPHLALNHALTPREPPLDARVAANEKKLYELTSLDAEEEIRVSYFHP